MSAGILPALRTVAILATAIRQNVETPVAGWKPAVITPVARKMLYHSCLEACLDAETARTLFDSRIIRRFSNSGVHAA